MGRDKGELHGPISPQSVLKMSSGQMIVKSVPEVEEDVSLTAYGLGLRISTYKGEELIYHGGSLPGYGSQIMWSSERQVGAAVLCNSNGLGNAVAEILSYRVIEDLLGLTRADWESLQRASWKSSVPVLKTVPNPLSPSVPLDSFYGKYRSKGYGDFTVCPFNNSSTSLHHPAACESLYSSLLHSLPLTDELNQPGKGEQDFFIERNSLFSTHLEGYHYSFNTWNVSRVMVTEEPGKDKLKIYEGHPTAQVRFRVDEQGKVKGMHTRGFWGEGTEVPKTGEWEDYALKLD